MNIMDRARAFVEWNSAIARQREEDRRRCPVCGSTQVYRHGSYTRHPWTMEGRQTVRVQRYRCQICRATHSEAHADLVPGGWYARSVRRYTIDQWLHGGSSLRRVAEQTRSLIGHQERWHIWQGSRGVETQRPPCHLSHSTLQGWLDGVGRRGEKQVAGLYRGISSSGQLGADGLWARLRGGQIRVLLMLRDSVSGLLWPPVTATGEEVAAAWQQLFNQAQQAGLALEKVQAVVSDGAQGLLSYLRETLAWVYQQRCIFHIWRNLSGELASEAGKAAKKREGDAAKEARLTVRRELVALIHRVVDAPGFEAAEQALTELRAHPHGVRIAQLLNTRLIELLVHLHPDRRGVGRVSPEWMWRDLRLRLSHGRNHGSEDRLRRAGLLFSIYHNFSPAQERRERKRHYRHPGKCALEVAGVQVEGYSYLDALGV
jgi:hypothetical protein